MLGEGLVRAVLRRAFLSEAVAVWAEVIIARQLCVGSVVNRVGVTQALIQGGVVGVVHESFASHSSGKASIETHTEDKLQCLKGPQGGWIL